MGHLTIFRRAGFESSHHLPNVPDGHKCKRMHGHSYRVEIEVSGDMDTHTGMVCDFGDLDHWLRLFCAELDHRTLNDFPGLANPTSEHIAVWFWERLKQRLPGLTAVTVCETERGGATYRGGGRDATDARPFDAVMAEEQAGPTETPVNDWLAGHPVMMGATSKTWQGLTSDQRRTVLGLLASRRDGAARWEEQFGGERNPPDAELDPQRDQIHRQYRDEREAVEAAISALGKSAA